LAEPDLRLGPHFHISGDLDEIAEGRALMSPRLDSAAAMRDSPLRYSSVAIGLHWTIALLIALDFALALYFSRFDFGDRDSRQTPYERHMPVAVWVLPLRVLRVAGRLLHASPALPADMRATSRLLAKGAHVLLYVYMLVAPLTGWIVLT